MSCDTSGFIIRLTNLRPCSKARITTPRALFGYFPGSYISRTDDDTLPERATPGRPVLGYVRETGPVGERAPCWPNAAPPLLLPPILIQGFHIGGLCKDVHRVPQAPRGTCPRSVTELDAAVVRSLFPHPRSLPGARNRHPKNRVDLFPAPHVVSSCELPQDRKVARVSGLWQVHGGSLIYPETAGLCPAPGRMRTVSANR